MANEPPPPPDIPPAGQTKSPVNEISDAPSNSSPPAGGSLERARPSGRSTRGDGSASERRALLQLSSAGFELASFSLLLGGAGYGVDYWLGNATPYFAVTGVVLGFCLGFYRLIVLASKMN